MAATPSDPPAFLRRLEGPIGVLARRCWDAVQIWSGANASRLAAALSFYAAVSISPLLVLALLALGAFLGPEAARGELDTELTQIFGAESAEFVERVLENAQQPRFGSLAGILSGLALLWGATNVFFQLQSALDEILGAGSRMESGVKGMLQKRLLSLGMILALGFLLLISLVAGTVLTALSDQFFSGFAPVWQWINQMVSLVLVALLFAAIFRILPNRALNWHQVFFGAVITALLFTLGKLGLTWYLGRGAAGSSYGIAGSVIVFLLWCFYSAQIFLFGAALVRARLLEEAEAANGDWFEHAAKRL